VLKHGIGIDQIEPRVGEFGQARAIGNMRVRVGDVLEPLARQSDHFVGNIHAMNFGEVAAHGTHQASGTAADLQGLPCAALSGRHAAQLGFQAVDYFRRGGVEIGVALLAAAEGDVVSGVLAGAGVPVIAHLVAHSAGDF
jgi:hypothetical protein